MVTSMPYNNFTQRQLNEIQAVFGIDTESEIYAVIGNILNHLSELPDADRGKPLSYDSLRIAAGVTEINAEKANPLKVAAYMLSDPNIGLFEQIFDVIDADSGEAQSFSFSEICNYINGENCAHPITKQQISAETFSKVVTVYFVATEKFRSLVAK